MGLIRSLDAVCQSRWLTRPLSDAGARRRPPGAPARAARAFSDSRSSALMLRLIATCGMVAIGVAIAAIMVSSGSAGWLDRAGRLDVSVVMSAVIWSARTPPRI